MKAHYFQSFHFIGQEAARNQTIPSRQSRFDIIKNGSDNLRLQSQTIPSEIIDQNRAVEFVFPAFYGAAL